MHDNLRTKQKIRIVFITTKYLALRQSEALRLQTVIGHREAGWTVDGRAAKGERGAVNAAGHLGLDFRSR